MRLPAESCQSMTEVRAGVDSIDRELVELLAERFRFMDAAARIKPGRHQVRDEPRKAQVLANVRGHAEEMALNADLIEALWEMLVEGSIAHELARWDRLRETAK